MNEFDLIRDIFQTQQRANQQLVCGIGDDAAVLLPPDNQQLVSCTDTLIAGRHFLLQTDAFSIGYKAVAVNLSDLAAMGATPHSILLALSIPQQLKEDKNWLTKFAKGLFTCCHAFGVQLIGGDTTQHDILTITVTALGFAEKCVYRHGAKEGDMIAVTGNIGDAAFALQQLLSDTQDKTPYALQHHLDQPTPRIEIGRWLNQQHIASSMIDISDGLLQDLGHICQQSGVGAALSLENLPTHQLLQQLPLEKRMQHQLSGGDDYELLFTFPKSKLTEIANCYLPTNITVIGNIVKQTSQNIQLFYKSQPYVYDNKGYQHF